MLSHVPGGQNYSWLNQCCSPSRIPTAAAKNLKSLSGPRGGEAKSTRVRTRACVCVCVDVHTSWASAGSASSAVNHRSLSRQTEPGPSGQEGLRLPRKNSHAGVRKRSTRKAQEAFARCTSAWQGPREAPSGRNLDSCAHVSHPCSHREPGHLQAPRREDRDAFPS